MPLDLLLPEIFWDAAFLCRLRATAAFHAVWQLAGFSAHLFLFCTSRLRMLPLLLHFPIPHSCWCAACHTLLLCTAHYAHLTPCHYLHTYAFFSVAVALHMDRLLYCLLLKISPAYCPFATYCCCIFYAPAIHPLQHPYYLPTRWDGRASGLRTMYVALLLLFLPDVTSPLLPFHLLACQLRSLVPRRRCATY